jgi:hypothetical protein
MRVICSVMDDDGVVWYLCEHDNKLSLRLAVFFPQ